MPDAPGGAFVAAGWTVSDALRSDGTLTGWGEIASDLQGRSDS